MLIGPLCSGQLAGITENSHGHRGGEIVDAVGSVVHQECDPAVGAEVCIFPGVAVSCEEQPPQVGAGGKGNQAGIGTALAVGGENRQGLVVNSSCNGFGGSAGWPMGSPWQIIFTILEQVKLQAGFDGNPVEPAP